MNKREKIISIIRPIIKEQYLMRCKEPDGCDNCWISCSVNERAKALADALIEAGFGDVTAWKGRAEKAEYSRLNAYRDDSKLEYKGYHTYIHYSAVDKVLYGKIEGIKDLVDFESESATEIENEFHKAVDDYIAFCKEVGKGVEEEKGE